MIGRNMTLTMNMVSLWVRRVDMKDRIYLTLPRNFYMSLDIQKLKEHIWSIYPNTFIRVSMKSLRSKNRNNSRILVHMEDKKEEFAAYINIGNVLCEERNNAYE